MKRSISIPTTDWGEIIKQEADKAYYQALMTFLAEEEAKGKVIYPPAHEVYQAFEVTPLAKTKVVILGQDPYINENQAHGIAFSVARTKKIPPSLRNIFKELGTDLGLPMPTHGNLTHWARQGVLLFSPVLTVEAGKSKSHAGKGWELLTDVLIEKLNEREAPVIFMLWGNEAKKKLGQIDQKRHQVLLAAHPSPLARGGFFGCGHFSQANELLRGRGCETIDWWIG